jgi:hypothetical protein
MHSIKELDIDNSELDFYGSDSETDTDTYSDSDMSQLSISISENESKSGSNMETSSVNKYKRVIDFDSVQKRLLKISIKK